MECSICQKLLSLFTEYGGRNGAELGGMEDVMHNTTCTVHPQMLADSLNLDLSADSVQSFRAQHSATDHSELIMFGNFAGQKKNKQTFGWSLLASPSTLTSKDRVRLVDPGWIDIEQIKRWKKRCNDLHGEKCSATFHARTLGSARPKWLVDCKQQCLVPGESPHSYITLSYVWGSIEPYKLTKQNLDNLQKPGAFSDPSVQAQLAASIKHAISLTLQLGETYLWVDALCIVQDDASSKHDEILCMASIFSNALMTIVLTQPNADHGIRGLQNISGARAYEQKKYELRKDIFMVQSIRGKSIGESRKPNIWSERGWTFQEELFSCRSLIFKDEIVHWKCRHGEYYEDRDVTDCEKEEDFFEDIRFLDKRSSPSMAGIWQALFREYSTRQLTYPEDAHDAISSTLMEMSKNFEGGFVSGLPILNFDVALLWQPERPMEKRIGKSSGKVEIPTWSWLGWSGELHQWDWHRTFGFLKKKGGPITEVVVEGRTWHIVDEKWTRDDMYRVIDSEQMYNAKYLEEHVAPPQGWTRYDNGLPKPGEEDDFAPWKFKHYLFPDLDFRYPIPMPDPNAPPTEPILAHYIATKTSQAELHCGERIPGWWPHHIAFALRDKDGKFVGSFRPNEWPFMDICEPEVEYAAVHAVFGMKLCFVELSLGSAKESSKDEFNIDEWRHPAREKNGSDYMFYNVMWVYWIGEIAYRHGLGRVEKAMWESLEQEEVLLILG